MNKIGYMLVGALFTLIISFGYIAFADSFHSTEPEIDYNEGTIQSGNDDIDTQGELNEVKTIEEQEILLVKENPVFVKANPGDSEKGQEHEEKINSSILSEQNVVQLTSAEKEVNDSEKESEHSEKKVKQSDFLQKIDKLEIEIENDHIEIEIKQERKKKNVKTEVEIEFDHEKVKMKGKKAEEFVEQMFSSVVVESPEDIQLVIKKMLTSYGVDFNTVEIEIKVKAKDKEYEYKH